MIKKILFIDDDKMILDMYQLAFDRRKDYQYLTAATSEQGEQIAKKEKPDLILLDLVFHKEEGIIGPVRTHAGYVLLKILKKDPQTKNIPIIVLTNLADGHEDEDKARKLGADDYIVKAKVLPREVIKRIDEMLGKK